MDMVLTANPALARLWESGEHRFHCMSLTIFCSPIIKLCVNDDILILSYDPFCQFFVNIVSWLCGDSMLPL